MPTIEENGLTINYGEAGEGPVLVLLHAAGSTGAQWRGVLGELDDKYHTITPDGWGHGKSSFWPIHGKAIRSCCIFSRLREVSRSLIQMHYPCQTNKVCNNV